MSAVAKLNKMQLHLLQFFSEKEVSNLEAEELQKLIAKYYFEKAEKELEQVLEKKKITQNELESLKDVHFRTPYLKK